MAFVLRNYTAPDFTRNELQNAPNALFVPAPKDGVAPRELSCHEHFPGVF